MMSEGQRLIKRSKRVVRQHYCLMMNKSTDFSISKLHKNLIKKQLGFSCKRDKQICEICWLTQIQQNYIEEKHYGKYYAVKIMFKQLKEQQIDMLKKNLHSQNQHLITSTIKQYEADLNELQDIFHTHLSDQKAIMTKLTNRMKKTRSYFSHNDRNRISQAQWNILKQYASTLSEEQDEMWNNYFQEAPMQQLQNQFATDKQEQN